MKKQILLLGVCLSLTGLVTAKNHEIKKDSLNENFNKSQLYYKIDVVNSGKLRSSLSGAFIGTNYVESLKTIPYIKEITKENDVTKVTPGVITDGINLEITSSSVRLYYKELVSLNNVLVDPNNKDLSIQVPVTRTLSYNISDLNLKELKGCLIVNELKEDKTELFPDNKDKDDTYINLKVCDSKEGLV